MGVISLRHGSFPFPEKKTFSIETVTLYSWTVLRIRIFWIRNILDPWIRICQTLRIHGSGSKKRRKNLFVLKTQIYCWGIIKTLLMYKLKIKIPPANFPNEEKIFRKFLVCINSEEIFMIRIRIQIHIYILLRIWIQDPIHNRIRFGSASNRILRTAVVQIIMINFPSSVQYIRKLCFRFILNEMRSEEVERIVWLRKLFFTDVFIYFLWHVNLTLCSDAINILLVSLDSFIVLFL